MTDADWPAELRGVTESVVTTRQPDGRFNLAALGLHAVGSRPTGAARQTVTARTWGDTRTWRNFEREREGVVQFTRDPVTFVEAALSVREVDDPVLPDVDAWVRVDVERVESGASGGTDWTDWSLSPVEVGVERRVVPTVNRGYNAVIEATVAASRLDVPAFDDAVLARRLAFFADVVRRCGGPREREAFALLDELVDR